MNKFTVGAIAVILLAFGGLVAWSSIKSSNEKLDYSTYDATKSIAADDNNGNIADHIRGKEDSSIVLVEYADLQCPGCASLMPKISKLHEQYGDRVAFIYRNYPIQGHQNARAAAAAAESAGQQGYYWEMVETIYENRNDWISVYDTKKRTDIFEGYFKDIAGDDGDADKFRSMLNDTNIQKKIDFDKGLGSNIDKVDATPSFYLNGEKIDIENTGDKGIDEVIAEKLNEALKAAGLKTGAKED